MNNTYRSIRNDSTNSWVAVPETSTARSKACTRAVTTVGALLVLGASGAANAALVSPCTGASLPASTLTNFLNPVMSQLTSAIDLLNLTNLNGVWNSLAAGNPIALNVLDTNGNIVGPNASCDVQGDSFGLTNPKGISLGGNKITGLGNGLTANAGEINSIALGNNASTDATATNAIAIGTNASVGANATGSMAIGSGASATTANSVALGANSTASSPAVPTAGATIGSTSYTFAGITPTGIISVGAPGAERQITNVAAGRLNAGSTDAVNGSQLYATNQEVNKLSSSATGLGAGAVKYDTNPDGTVNYNSVTMAGAPSTDGGVTGGTKITNVQQGAVNATSTDAVNGAQLYQVTGDTSSTYITQNGRGIRYVRTNDNGLPLSDASAQGQGSTAVGYNATTAAGATNGLALGNGATANNAGDVALGAGSVTAAANPTASGTINGTTYTYAGGNSTSVVSVGAPGAERQITNVAAGRLNAGSTDAVNGSQLYATNQEVNKLSSSVTGLGASAVKYDTNPDGTVNYNSVTMAGTPSTDGGVTGGTKITNVQQGAVNATSTDAVNGAQLFTTNQKVGNLNLALTTAGDNIATYLGGGSVYNPSTGGLSMPTFIVQGGNYNSVFDAFKAVDNKLTDLGNQIGNQPQPVKYSNPSTPTTPLATGSNPTQDVTLVGNNQTQPVRMHNVEDGALAPNSKDAVNGGQLYQVQQQGQNLGNSVASNLGGGSTYDPNTGKVSNPNYSVYGKNVNNVGDAVDQLQKGAPMQYSDSNGKAVSAPQSNDVTLVGKDTSSPVLLHNVADGVKATDAVNVRQLNSQISAVQSSVNSVASKAYAGIAGATALTMIPDLDLGKRFSLGVGTATYQGMAAVAVGATARIGENLKAKLGVGTSSAGTTYGGGVAYQW